MSDKTPRDDSLDQDSFDLAFPGTPEDELPEEVRNFAFDEDYLGEDFSMHQGEADAFLAEEPAPRDSFLSGTLKKLSAGKGKKRTAELTMAEKNELPQIRVSRRFKKYIPADRVRGSVTVGRDLRSDEMLVYDSELDEIDYTDEEDLPEARDYMPIRFARHGRVGVAGGILYGLFVISVSIILACMAWMFAADALALSKEPKSAVVFLEEYVPTGDMPVVNDEGKEIQVDVDQVASALKSAGIIEYKWLFKLFCGFCHGETKMEPGTYDVNTEQDYYALVQSMHFGSDTQQITRVTFPEGYTMEQIFTLLEENIICEKDELYEAAANYDFDYDFLDEVPLGDASRLEGFLFPDTYDFYQGEDAPVAISRFLRNMDNKLTDEIREDAEDQGLTIREAIILASLVEKEAGADDDRTILSSIIHNRLDDGWKLQLDSTINYILGTSTFELTYDDLEVESPYNTYLHEGLPVGPIGNPGLASIQAAVDPADTNYWFWYAVDGETHYFTNSDDFDAFRAAHPY